MRLVIGIFILMSAACVSVDETETVYAPNPDSTEMGQSSGGGGTTGGGNSTTTTGGSAGNTGPAEYLGAPCGGSSAIECPQGYQCLNTSGDPSVGGFCSIPCSTLGQPDVCVDGFPGPGAAMCMTATQAGTYFCSVLCGDQYGGNDCPIGLSCQSFNGGMACLP